MGKRDFSKFSFFVSLLMVLQLVFPMANSFAATDTSTGTSGTTTGTSTSTSSGTTTGTSSPNTSPSPSTSLLPPSNLADQLLTPSDVKLTWNSVYGAAAYNVYQIVNGTMQLLGKATTTSYTANNLAQGSYQYDVTSLGSDGSESGPSAPVSVTITYPTMQAPATLTKTMQNGNDIVLNWTASQYATSYNVYQIAADGTQTLVGTATGKTTYTVTNSPAGTFTYAVSAVNSLYGESTLSTPLQVTVTYPTMTAPSSLTDSLANVNNVTLQWNSVPYATAYKVYQIVNGQKVLQSTVTTTSVTYNNAPAGDYVYEVHSYSDRFGESTDGSQVSFTVGAINMTAPSNLASTIQNGNDIVLKWDAVPNATSYKVYQIVNGQKTLQSTVTGTTVDYPNLPAGTYQYEVHSYNTNAGESTDGSQISVTLAPVVMAAPGNLAYTIQNGNDIVLTWDAVQYATSYKVYQIANGQKTLLSTTTGTTATLGNKAAGDYTLEVDSESTRFGESPTGSQVTLTLTWPTITPPANLVQTVLTATSFRLNWDPASYATSYKVYQIVNGQAVLKSTVTTTTVSFANMTPGDYTYEVTAVSSRFGESATGTQLTFTLNSQTMQPPTNLTYRITNGNDLTLSWTAAPYATSYKIYQVINGQNVLQSTVTGTSVYYPNLPAGDYDYVVDSVSTQLGESPTGAETTFSLVYPTMAPPSNLTASVVNGNSVVMNWGAVQYATGYNVYEIVNGQEVLQKSVTTNNLTLTNVAAGDHTYVVHSVSSSFGESADSNTVDATVAQVVMAAPGNFNDKIVNGNDIQLSWSAVTYADKYNVYQISNGQKTLIGSVTGTSVTYPNQPAGDYTYEVDSYSNRFGESPQGSQVSFTLTFPVMQAPANLTQSIVNGNDIVLRWTAASYATKYNIYTISNGQKTLIGSVTNTSVDYPNQPAGDYTYEVDSYSTRFGESPVGSQVSLTLTFPVMQAPANLTQSIVNGNDIVLRWNAANYATKYNIYQISNGQKTLVSSVTGTVVDYTNMPQGNYTYEVDSYSDRFGESPVGSQITFTLTWPVVQPPTLQDSVLNFNNIKFTWNSVTWATEYHLYDTTNGGHQLIYKGTNLTYEVYNLTQSTHTYVVTAYNTRFGESAPSNTISENIVYPVMDPPAASLTLLNSTSAQISWNFVTYANGYNVYEVTNGQPVMVAQDVNNLSYTVSNLSYANHYYYVTSYSNSFGESKPSNTVEAKLIVDTTPPVTTATAPTGWSNQSATVTLSATDDMTGVAQTYYSVNGGAYTEGTSLTVDQEGDNQVSFYSVDNAGNKETPHTIDVKIDKTAPTTTSSAPTTWSTSDVTVNLSATDALSGVANTYYSIDGSSYAAGTTFTVSGEGDHKVSFYSVDNAGNTETAQTVDVKIDKTAPVTTSDAPAAWSNNDVTVNLSATDNLSGVATTYYSVDGSSYTAGTTFTVSGEGDHKVSYYSVDNVGNTETAQTVDVKIDKTAPVTTSDAPTTWSTSDVTVNLSATDNLSGVATTYYSVDGSSYTAGKTFTVSGEGDHKVSYYSVDNAGNTETANTVDVKIDKTAPVTTADAPTTWSTSDVTVNLSATDNLSGVANTYYSVDGSSYTAGKTFTVSGEGDHKVSYYSVDNAGNTETANTVDVKIDQTAPVTKSDAPTTWATNNVTVNLTATDNLSGVANTYYSIDGSDYTTGNSFTISSNGDHQVSFYSVDNAGNKEAAQTVEVKIDQTAPVISMNLNNEYPLGTILPLTYTATDDLSGVVSQKLTVAGPILNQTGKVMTNNSKLLLWQPGTYTITVTATNGAGLTATFTKQIVVYIPVGLDVTPQLGHDNDGGSDHNGGSDHDGQSQKYGNDQNQKDSKDHDGGDSDGNQQSNKDQQSDKDNNGVFTVRVDMPKGFLTDGFDLSTVTLNGVQALSGNNGYVNQAKNGQFKFDRADFNFSGTSVVLQFRGYDYGFLVEGQTTVNLGK